MRIKKSLIIDFSLALFVFLPSLAPIPLLLHLFLLPFLIPNRIKVSYSLLILILIPILSFFNQLTNIDLFLENNYAIKELVPYSIFMIVSYFFAIKVNIRALKLIVYFVVGEVIVGVFEYFLGVRSFLPSVREAVGGLNPFGHNGLLYYSRVSGLSSNSSVLAMKILVAIMITHFLRMENKQNRNIIYLFLGIGLIVTFTRSVFVAVVIFAFLVNFPIVKNMFIKLLKGKTKLVYIFLAALGSVGVGFAISKIDVLVRQLNRGMKTADLSGRDMVFQVFSEFINDNLLFGNGSYKLWIEIDNRLFHAHNVYVQTLATNGLFIATLYFLLIIINLNKFNVKYIVPILILSIFQYAIFWGISFVDLVFFTFLLIKQNQNLYKHIYFEKDFGKN